MQRITPNLWFEDQAEEAAKFYTAVFKNSKINTIAHYGSAGPLPAGTVMMVDFELDGQQVTALNGGPADFKFNESPVADRQLRVAGRGGLLLAKAERRR